MTRAEALRIAKLIRAGADPKPYQVGGVLPDAILDAIVDLSLGSAK